MDPTIPFLGSAICFDVSVRIWIWNVAELLVPFRAFDCFCSEESMETGVTVSPDGLFLLHDSENPKWRNKSEHMGYCTNRYFETVSSVVRLCDCLSILGVLSVYEVS